MGRYKSKTLSFAEGELGDVFSGEGAPGPAAGGAGGQGPTIEEVD